MGRNTSSNKGNDKIWKRLYKASKIRVSPTQLPEIYNILPPICDQLEIVEPEFYLEMNPMPNAYAFGDTKTAITVTSSLVEMMSKDELTAVVAHECGHIACHHMLYHSLAQILAMLWECLKHLPTLPFLFITHLCTGNARVNCHVTEQMHMSLLLKPLWR